MRKGNWSTAVGCLALALIAFVSRPVRAQLAVDQVSDFDNGSDVDQYSGTGEASLTYTPGASITYENVVANGQWIVQNLPMLSTAQVSGPQTENVEFNLSEIGGSDGTQDTATVGDFSTVTPTPVTSAPGSGTPGSFTVANTEEQVNSGVPSGVATPAAPLANPVNWGSLTAGQILGVQNAFISGVGNVVQQKNFCGPGAAANALSQMGALVYSGQTANQAMVALAPLMGNANDGNWDNDEASGLFQYAKKYSIPLAEAYTGGAGNGKAMLPNAGNYTDPVTGSVATNDGTLTGTWILDQLADDDNVQYMTDTHWVSLVGDITWGPITLLEYRDDPYQAGAGTTMEQQNAIAGRYMWTYLYNGNTDIGNGQEVAGTALTEYLVPEPASASLLLIASSGMLMRRRWNRG